MSSSAAEALPLVRLPSAAPPPPQPPPGVAADEPRGGALTGSPRPGPAPPLPWPPGEVRGEQGGEALPGRPPTSAAMCPRRTRLSPANSSHSIAWCVANSSRGSACDGPRSIKAGPLVIGTGGAALRGGPLAPGRACAQGA